jgi:hypothetical protein
MDYFQSPLNDAALPVIPAEGAAVHFTGLTVKSPVNVMVSVSPAKSLPNFFVVSVMVHVSSEFRQKEACVRRIEFELFGFGVAKTLAYSFAFEAGECGPLFEEISIRPVEILECVL